jgi:hypothetical protein
MTPFEGRLKSMKRRYYEVFGDLEAEVEFRKLVSLILFALLFVSGFGAFVLAKRPPVVIRVTEVGKAEVIRDLHANNAPTEPEILYFAQNFTKRFTEYNAYTVSRDISEAINMMTERFQKSAWRNVVESGLLAKIEEAKLHASVEFKESKLERETEDHLVVTLVGGRTLKSYKNESFKESNLFKSELILRKVARSRRTPQGLLVDQYSEIILNRIEEPK